MPTRYLPPIAGSWTNNTFGTITTFVREYTETGSEVLVVSNNAGDHVTPNSFLMRRSFVSGGIVTGSYHDHTVGNGRDTVSPFPSRIYDYRGLSVPTIPSIPSGLANALYAKANPDRPEVLPFDLIQGIRELPRLIRDLGYLNFAAKKNRNAPATSAAALWLSGNFGWAPLISDLKKLVTFSDAFARREKEIDALYSNQGLRRKVNLFSATGPQQSQTLTVDSVDSSFGNNSATGAPTVRVWGTVRYFPERTPDGSILKRPTPAQMRRRILGLNAASVTLNIWEAVPWSWLIDYFVNVGDWLAAHPAGRTAVPSNGCIMTHRMLKLSAPSKNANRDKAGHFFTVSPGFIMAESKSRDIANPTLYPEVLMNPLSGHQLSILGAIGVLKGRLPKHYR